MDLSRIVHRRVVNMSRLRTSNWNLLEFLSFPSDSLVRIRGDLKRVLRVLRRESLVLPRGVHFAASIKLVPVVGCIEARGEGD